MNLWQVLLQCGADMEQVDESGKTPLLISFAQGHVEVARLLLSKGLCHLISCYPKVCVI
jgi:ankyrin repeat protein